MSKKKYLTPADAIQRLSKKRDIRIDRGSKTMKIIDPDSPERTNDLGNKSWGAIDYLRKEGYTYYYVKDFRK